jgi:hypothetical protein
MQLMTLRAIFGNCRLPATRLMLMFSAILGFASRVSETTRNGSNQESAGSSSACVRAANAKAQSSVGPASCKVTLKRFNVMRAIVVMVAVLLVGALRPESAHAWASANRWGGSTTHTCGATSHTNAWGGSTSHAYGVGTEHTNMYGGSSAHAWGGGTEHTNVYGGSTYGAYGAGATHTYASGATAYHPPSYGGYGYSAYHPPGYGYGYPAYHPPVAVPYYSASGCLGCAVAAGAVVGATVGAVAASANTAAAYSSGYAAGSAAGYAMGVNYAALPTGCAYQAGPNEYLCGGSWFRPAYGANGLYYTVVPAP